MIDGCAHAGHGAVRPDMEPPHVPGLRRGSRRRRRQDLAAANRAALRTTEMLGCGLQDARRDVARTVELMQRHGRQRGPERDYGPSR